MLLFDRIKKEWKKLPTFWRTLLYLSLLIFIVGVLTSIFKLKNAELEEDQRWFVEGSLQKGEWKALAVEVVVMAPIEEEVRYRGPAYVLILIFGLISLVLAKRCPNNKSSASRIFSLVKPILIWMLIVVPTVSWALMHPYPLIIFVAGLFFGWAMVKTRPAVFGLGAAIVAHMAWNLATLFVISFRGCGPLF